MLDSVNIYINSEGSGILFSDVKQKMLPFENEIQEKTHKIEF